MYRKRLIKKQARKNTRNLLITLVFLIILIYASLNWILPSFIGGLGLLTSTFKPAPKQESSVANSPLLAPPELLFPYEATNIPTIDIEGFAVTNSRVELYLDDILADTANVPGDGRFIFKNIPLKLGTNNIYAITVDENGKKSLASKKQIVIFDNEKPILEVSEPQDGIEVQGNRQLTIIGQTEKGVLVFINNNQIIVDQEGNFKSIQQLNDGDNNFDIKATDEANNSTEVTRKVVFHP